MNVQEGFYEWCAHKDRNYNDHNQGVVLINTLKDAFIAGTEYERKAIKKLGRLVDDFGRELDL